MSDDLARLLELPTSVHLAIADGEIVLLTITHETLDRLTVERQRLGRSIDVTDLLQRIGQPRPVVTPPLHVSEVAMPQLPAPAEIAAAPLPTTRRTTKHQASTPELEAIVPAGFPCPDCERTFKNPHARVVHQGRAHKADAVPSVVTGDGSGAVLPLAPETNDRGVAVSEHECSVCRTSLRLHDRCSDCQSLLGPKHDAGMALQAGGRVLCGLCIATGDLERTLGIEGAAA